MIRNPFAGELSPGRLRLALRTLAANENVPLDATAPPRTRAVHVDTALMRNLFATPATIPAPSLGPGVDAGRNQDAPRS